MKIIIDKCYNKKSVSDDTDISNLRSIVIKETMTGRAKKIYHYSNIPLPLISINDTNYYNVLPYKRNIVGPCTPNFTIIPNTNLEEITYGFEMEKENSLLYSKDSVYSLSKKTKFSKVTDGSLSNNGFELVSPIFNYNSLNKVVKSIEDYCNETESSNRCGFHVHIGKKYESISDIYSFLYFNILIISAIYKSRWTNSYCSIGNVFNENSESKYKAIRLDYNTVEVRLFPVVKNSLQIYLRINLLQNLIDCYNVYGHTVKLYQRVYDKLTRKVMKENYCINNLCDSILDIAKTKKRLDWYLNNLKHLTDNYGNQTISI